MNSPLTQKSFCPEGTHAILYNSKYSRAGNFREFRKYREIFLHANICPLSSATRQFLKVLSYLKIRENFLHANCLWPKFAKFSCREIFLFYSILWLTFTFISQDSNELQTDTHTQTRRTDPITSTAHTGGKKTK